VLIAFYLTEIKNSIPERIEKPLNLLTITVKTTKKCRKRVGWTKGTKIIDTKKMFLFQNRISFCFNNNFKVRFFGLSHERFQFFPTKMKKLQTCLNRRRMHVQWNQHSLIGSVSKLKQIQLRFGNNPFSIIVMTNSN
jgi:hypothetical protein